MIDARKVRTNDIYALKEHVAEDVHIAVAAALNATERVPVSCGAEPKVVCVERVQTAAHGKCDVGQLCVRWIFPAAVVFIVYGTVDLG